MLPSMGRQRIHVSLLPEGCPLSAIAPFSGRRKVLGPNNRVLALRIAAGIVGALYGPRMGLRGSIRSRGAQTRGDLAEIIAYDYDAVTRNRLPRWERRIPGRYGFLGTIVVAPTNPSNKMSPKRRVNPLFKPVSTYIPTPRQRSKPSFKIATWNINGLKSWLRQDAQQYVDAEQPDVLCLQETRCNDDTLVEKACPNGYCWFASHCAEQRGYSGVVTFCKQRPLSVSCGINHPAFDGEGRCIVLEYAPYFVVNVYVPNAGRSYLYRMAWDLAFRRFLKDLEKIKSKPIVVCGDLNVAHHSIDIFHSKPNTYTAGFTPDERANFGRLLDCGFVDAFRHLYPDQQHAYSHWSYLKAARQRNVGWRLDYVLVTKSLADNIVDCVIRKEVLGSDHCPVVVFLALF